MNIIKALDKSYLTSEILNTPCFMILKKPFNNGLIHFHYFCDYLTEGEDAHYDKVYTDYGQGIFKDFKLVSLNFIKENKENYCLKCLEYAATIPEDLDFDEAVNADDFLAGFKDINSFLKAKSCNFETTVNLLTFLDKLKINKNLEALASSYITKVKAKAATSKAAYPDTQESVKTFHKKLAEFIVKGETKESLNKEDAFEALLLKQNQEAIKFLLDSEKLVIFSTFNLNLSDLFYWSSEYDDALQKLIFKTVFNPMFEFGPFAVLPYVEFKFLETFVYTSEYHTSKLALKSKHVVVNELPSTEVFETFKGLYDEDNETLSSYANVLEAAKTV